MGCLLHLSLGPLAMPVTRVQKKLKVPVACVQKKPCAGTARRRVGVCGSTVRDDSARTVSQKPRGSTAKVSANFPVEPGFASPVASASLAAQRASTQPPRDSAGARTAVAPSGGRRAVAWKEGKVLGSHGGLRSRVGAKRRAAPAWERKKQKCRLCGKKFTFVAKHDPQCCCAFSCETVSKDRGNALGPPVRQCFASGTGDPLAAALLRCTAVGRRTWAENSSARPGHEGVIFGWGWCYRYQKPFQCLDTLAPPVRAAFTALTAQCSRPGFADVKKAFKSLLSVPVAQVGAPGGVVAYLGDKYSPGACGHPPPPPVAALLGATSCKEDCDWCAKWDCISCPKCPLHVDVQDPGATVACFFQRRRSPVGARAYFIVGRRAFSLAGGLAVGFQPEVPHGVWAPPGAHADDQCQWTGVAFVRCKTPQLVAGRPTSARV